MKYHYGFSLKEINSMSMKDATTYMKALKKIKAENNLELMQAADYPHLTKDARRSVHKQVSKPLVVASTNPVTTDQLASILGAM